MDGDGMEAPVRPLHDVTEEVVRRFAATGRVGEEEAKRRLRPLLKEVGVLAHVSWGPPVGERGTGSGGPSAAELARRSERLNARAVEALIHFYLDEGHARDNAWFAETRRTWEAYQSLTGRLRRRRRLEASERYRAAWQDWGAAQG